MSFLFLLGFNFDRCIVALCEFASNCTRSIYSRFRWTTRRYGISIKFSMYNWKGNYFDDSIKYLYNFDSFSLCPSPFLVSQLILYCFCLIWNSNSFSQNLFSISLYTFCVAAVSWLLLLLLTTYDVSVHSLMYPFDHQFVWYRVQLHHNTVNDLHLNIIISIAIDVEEWT